MMAKTVAVHGEAVALWNLDVPDSSPGYQVRFNNYKGSLNEMSSLNIILSHFRNCICHSEKIVIFISSTKTMDHVCSLAVALGSEGRGSKPGSQCSQPDSHRG